MPHHHTDPEAAQTRHHVEGEGRHTKEQKKTKKEQPLGPGYTPESRTGQESDFEPEGAKIAKQIEEAEKEVKS